MPESKKLELNKPTPDWTGDTFGQRLYDSIRMLHLHELLTDGEKAKVLHRMTKKYNL